MNFLKKIFSVIRDVYFLIFRYSSECQLRAQKKKNILTGEESGFGKFDSYADLKNYQKKIKLFLAGIFSFGVIFSVIFILAVVFLIQYLYEMFHIDSNVFDWSKIKDFINNN